MLKKILLFCFFWNLVLEVQASPIDPNNTGEAKAVLKKEQQDLLQKINSEPGNKKALLERMLDLGLWEGAKKEITLRKGISETDFQLLNIRYEMLNNNFSRAEELLKPYLHSSHVDFGRYQAWLKIEAWELEEAEKISKALLVKNPRNEELKKVLGRALLLQKKYNEALQLAKSWQAENPASAGAHLLEADVYFWDQQPQKAEAPLMKSLELDPFNADARFSYGYAIWRRIDATQLNQMAAQWELALLINPLHFQTHWHWGNGHTQLTFADYADKDEKAIRERLAAADSLFTAGLLEQAIDTIQSVGRQYPASVLPAMHEASLLYSDFSGNKVKRMQELERSQNLFLEILDKKQNYGPAHNGLAAVIKSKRLSYLRFYDSLMQAMLATPISDLENFKKVFPDMEYYPGKAVQAMVWSQMYSSVAYFPFLSRQDRNFVIPPLHIDLAIAMNSPFFRTRTTFDNRQWMDIRGVGSGAADIGYTERGAFLERNVVLHEFVHLFHGRVLTDQENRKIRALYNNAMKNNLTLDYYSRNNESEYFAQTYPAYFEPVKVHPLDFKSMNTTADLKAKDPDMYAFLDELVKKERAYLAGNKEVMASNWSQVYINMSRASMRRDSMLARKYLDTALIYDRQYQPAYIAYAQLKQSRNDFPGARKLLQQAEAINNQYAPVYAAYADLLRTENATAPDAVKEQINLLQKAISLEDDFQTAAGLHVQLRDLYLEQGEVAQAIKVAENYARTGPDVSTYLRNRLDDARMFAGAHKAFGGDFSLLDSMKRIVALNPQNYEYRGLFSDALQAAGRYEESIRNMEEVQRILASTGNQRPDFALRLAESRYKLNQLNALNEDLNFVLQKSGDLEPLMAQRLVKLLVATNRAEDARKLLSTLPASGTPYYERQYRETKSLLDK